MASLRARASRAASAACCSRHIRRRTRIALGKIRRFLEKLAMRESVAETIFDEQASLRCRGDFPSLRRSFGGHPVAFLDGPGGTQVPNAVIDAIADCYRNRNVNTHVNFPPSVELDARHLGARSAIADFLGASG